jgi:E3 ubiquitin-protein ligase RNF168
MFKRVKEQFKFSLKLKEQEKLNASLNDYLCPICLEILIEPVDMPCKHEICLKCFDTMLDQTNLCCPMCRQRISTWARTARISNSVVNLKKWKQIQELFPKEVKNRLEGKPTEPIEDLMPTVKKQKCVNQGEIRQEYLDLLKKVSKSE